MTSSPGGSRDRRKKGGQWQGRREVGFEKYSGCKIKSWSVLRDDGNVSWQEKLILNLGVNKPSRQSLRILILPNLSFTLEK